MLNLETLRLSAAALILICYLLLCIRLLQRKRHAATPSATQPIETANSEQRQQWLIAYASQTGNAELLAQQTAKLMAQHGITAELLPLDQISLAHLQPTQRALFIVSTTGEGDAPDNAGKFAARVMRDKALRLPHLQYGLLALGDASYAHFCGFGRQLDDWLQSLGARSLFNRIDVDQLAPASLQQWQNELNALSGGDSTGSAWHDDNARFWTLLERECLNPGSQGAPLYRLALQAPADYSASWQAGDLVRLIVKNPDGSPAAPRQYSIASIPASGKLELLVRQQLHDDGSLGLASGWLTSGCAVGGAVPLALQPHPGFQIGGNAQRPLILIGNGSGLAGLRSHLQARAAQTGEAAPCWLLFGERNAAHDSLLAGEIERWQADGLLSRVDRVFSRDGDSAERYVQQRLLNQAARLRQWLDDGAAIYVCGSQKGMGEGVDNALRELIGEAARRALIDSGRYRRDLY